MAEPATDRTLDTVLKPRTKPARPGPLSAIITFTWRAVRKIRHDPEPLIEALGVPIMFTLVFGYLLGGALAGSPGEYMQSYVPGIVVFTGIMISMRVSATVNADNAKAVSDRFRSLSIWRPVPLVGTLLGNNVLYLVGCVAAVLVGLLVGFSPEGGLVGVVLAILLALVFTFSFSWVYVVLGLAMKSPASALSTCQIIVFPVLFVSNFFVGQETLPGWLRAIVDVNPFALTVTAARGLAHGTVTASQLGWALVGCAALVAVFGPLSGYLYRTKR